MAQTRGLLTWLPLALAVQTVLSQDAKCYYPNGSEAPKTEKPCSSAEGSACCPDKWQCLDNGLCHYPSDNLYGRYSCTDKDWKADGCPSNMCTYDMSAAGGESITQCKDHDNDWCCNADAVHVNCCKESPEPRPFFALESGKAYATVGSNQADQVPILATITGKALGKGDSPSPTKTPEPSTSGSRSESTTTEGSSSRSSPSPTPTSSITSFIVSSGPSGPTTVTQTLPAPVNTSGAPPSQQSSSKSNIGLIVGCAVGIPLGLALIGVLIFLLRKRSQQKKNPYSPDPYATGEASPHFAGGAKFGAKRGSDDTHVGSHNSAMGYKNEAGVAELGGAPLGPGRPISTIKGHAELDSGGAYAAGVVPHGPNTVGIGGGNAHAHEGVGSSWGSAPPGYSPGMNQNHWAGAAAAASRPEMAEAPNTPYRPHTENFGLGAAAGAGAQHTEGGRYIPYRPPPTEMSADQHPNVVEMNAVPSPSEREQGAVEMNAVPSPPERQGQVELSAQPSPPARQ